MPLIPIDAQSFGSFADVAFADNYLLGDVARAAAWAAIADANTKARGLVSATRMLQRLGWCVDPAPDPAAAMAEIPVPLSEVTAMLAADLLAKPKLFADASGNSNVKSVKAGSAQVEFFSPAEGAPPIPMALWTMLFNAGLVGCVEEDGSNAGAYVTGIVEDCRPLGGRYRIDWPCAEQDYS